jgi:hypothetical protein
MFGEIKDILDIHYIRNNSDPLKAMEPINGSPAKPKNSAVSNSKATIKKRPSNNWSSYDSLPPSPTSASGNRPDKTAGQFASSTLAQQWLLPSIAANSSNMSQPSSPAYRAQQQELAFDPFGTSEPSPTHKKLSPPSSPPPQRSLEDIIFGGSKPSSRHGGKSAPSGQPGVGGITGPKSLSHAASAYAMLESNNSHGSSSNNKSGANNKRKQQQKKLKPLAPEQVGFVGPTLLAMAVSDSKERESKSRDDQLAKTATYVDFESLFGKPMASP